MISSYSIVLLFLLIFQILHPSLAQIFDDDDQFLGDEIICSCSPRVFKWTIDFSSVCPPADVSPGIQKVFCDIDYPSGANESVAESPIEFIQSYQLIELSRTLETIRKEDGSDLNLRDGDVISFTSLTQTEPSRFAGGFQAHVIALNENGDELNLSWIVRYTNECEVLPFTEGDSLGWMVFVSWYCFIYYFYCLS